MAVLSQVMLAMLLAASVIAQQPSPPATQAPAARHGFRIAGVAVNSLTGQPISSATVAIAPIIQGGEREISKSATTGADGRFSFDSLSKRKYSLMASAHGFSLQSYEHHDAFATAIAVGPELDSEHLTFRLEPDASIEGVVTDDNNDPVQYATVRLYQTNAQGGLRKAFVLNQIETDDQGHYRFGHLSPGTYYLAATARPWYAQNIRPQRGERYHDPKNIYPPAGPSEDDAALDVAYPLTFYPGATESGNATPIQLTPGERETADMVLHAVPGLHLRIHTGSSSNAVVGRMIFPHVQQRLFDGNLEDLFNSPSSWVAPGVFEISALTPGHYVVQIAPSTEASAKGNARGWYREIDLAGDMDVSMGEGPGFATIMGTIVFENTRVPRHSSIVLFSPDTSESFGAEIAENGSFEFKADHLRPGRYLLSLSARDFYLKKVVTTGARMNGRAIEIGAAANVHIAAVAAHGEGQVDGTVLHDGEAFAGAMVVLVPQDAGNNAPLFRRDQSDSDGTFTLPNVVPGQYNVIAIANGWDLEWGNPSVLQPYLKKGQPVQVPPDGKLQVKVEVQ